MKKEITAAYMHQLLKSQLFAHTNLSRIGSMSDDERRVFNVAQIDNILGMRSHGDALGWFIGQFFKDDAGSEREENPLYDEQSDLVDWYLELLSLGSDLYFHRPFDLDKLQPGLALHGEDIKDDFRIENVQLVEWLRTTEYRRVAGEVTYLMLRLEFDRVVGNNDAVQDFYAERCRSDRFNPQTVEACNEFVTTVLSCFEQISAHRQKGRLLGLNDEQMRVVDALWGWAPHDYEQSYVDAAKELVAAVDDSLPGPTVMRSPNGFKRYKKEVLPAMVSIVEKYDLGVDLTDRYNLTMGYLNEWLLSKYLGDRELDEYYF